MANKLVNLRLDTKLLKELDSVVRDGLFSNRTEFIKDSLRKAVDDFQTKRALASLKKHFGEGKRLGIKEPTLEEFEKIREKVWKELHSDN